MNFFKPFFKRISALNINNPNLNYYKLLQFKRKKWLKVLLQLKQHMLKNKFKLIDQNKILLNIYSTKFNNYNNKYKFYFLFIKNLKQIYLNLKVLKLNKLKIVLNQLENRVDIILIRSKLCLNLRSAKKLIINGYIFVNNVKIIIKSHVLNSGNFLKIKIDANVFKKYLIKSLKWQIPINNLLINYSIKELLVLNLFQLLKNFILYFPYSLNLKIIL